MRDRVTYFLKRPGGARVHFALIRKTVSDSGCSQKTVSHASIDAINKSLGVLPLVDANFQALAIVKKLNEEERKKRMGGYVANEANCKLLKDYWDKVYEYKKITDKRSAWNRLQRAVTVLGTTGILAERREVQRLVDQALASEPRVQRATIATLNQMRKFYGIQEALAAEQNVPAEFKYLTHPEFKQVLAQVARKDLIPFFEVLFYTGVRVGECFYLRPEHYRKPAVSILGQVDRAGARRQTKTRKVRKTVCIKQGHESLLRWFDVPNKEALRCLPFAKLWKAACKRAFPNDASKWTCVHDLRHSFAVYMLTEKKLSTTLISKLLGNSLAVCENYYTNFVLEDDTLTAVLANL